MIETLQELRVRVARLEGFAPPQSARLCPTGWPSVDAALPGGGLLQGALHEIHAPTPIDGAALGFAVRLLGRFLARMPDRQALWASCRDDLFAPGLIAVGVDPGRLLLVRCRDPDDLLFAFEEAIKSKCLSVVLGEIGALDFSSSRRLQLAAAASGTGLILLRPARFAAVPSAAVTRWRAEAAPDGWSLTLFRCRGGRPARWQHMPPAAERC
jgi:protein ImuA